jgi:SAM-dependent methyltransferase
MSRGKSSDMQQRDLYELQAAQDAQTLAAPDARDREFASWLSEALERRRAGITRILELGCGKGGLSYALAQIPRVHVHGVDISATYVACAVAGAATLPHVRFSVLDLDRELDRIEAASSEVVVSIDVLEHVFDVFGFVRHVARIACPGGLVLLRVPNLAYIRHRLGLARGKLPVTSSWFGPPGDLTAWRTTWGWDGGHLHCFTQATLERLLLDAGLRPLEWRDPGARFSHLRRIAPALLAGNLAVLAERVA